LFMGKEKQFNTLRDEEFLGVLVLKAT